MRLPDFLIIGSAKSGTTTLYEYLCRHPQIFMSTPKEPNFFAKEINYQKGIEWYASLFEEAQAGQICGEASTPYTHQLQIPDLIERIFRVLPDVKLIYIIRHPVDRAYSQYQQQIKIAQGKNRRAKVKAFKIPETFEELLQRGKQVIEADDYMNKIDVLAASNYIAIIERYLEYFDRQSFLFLLLDDLVAKPQKTIERVCDFLNIEREIDLIPKEPIKANLATEHRTWYLRSQITAPLKEIPGVSAMADLMPKKIRDSAYSILKRMPYKKYVEQQYLPQPMLPETRAMLLQKFQEPNQRLAEFLNRDLSHWSV